MVRALKTQYTDAEYSDVSVQYCFVSLLQLANENNLDIRYNDTQDDLLIQCP